MQIGERIFSLRQKAKQSLQEVADAVGVSKAHIWELEKGRSANPSFDLVRRLADHFGVSLDVLTGDTTEPDAEGMQVNRLHRGLEQLTQGDRDIVEEMIRLMKERSGSNGPAA